MIKIIIWYIVSVLALIILVYLLSRVQMKAWFHELDKQLGKKFTNYVNNKKEKKDDNTEEKV